MAEKSVTQNRKIPVWNTVLDGNEESYLLDALRSNWISSSGKYITALEETFSQSCGALYGVAVSSGTAAIHLALLACGVKPGDEVIVPCFNLIVGSTTVIWTGAKPVLVDADPKTWCLDPAKIEEKITPRTKAILAVHMYGHPCDMDPILVVARKHGLKVIEDGAEAHGVEYKGKKVGALGDAGCFSFYGNKILTMGEGGVLVTNDKAIAEKTRLLRNQAFEEPRFVHNEIGFNYRLTNLQAAIGLAQCEKLEEKVKKKRRIGKWYSSLLIGQPGISIAEEAPWAKSVYWMFGVVLSEEFGCSRNEVMKQLNENGVETRAFFHPMHQQPVFLKGNDPRYPDTRGSYPVSERLGNNGLYLPSSLDLTQEQAEYVVKTLLNCRGKKNG